MNRDRRYLYCKKCDEPCKHDEINEDMICIDCDNIFCELGGEDNDNKLH